MIANSFNIILVVFLITTVTLLFYANTTSSYPLHAESLSTSYISPFSLHKRYPTNTDTLTSKPSQQLQDPFESIQSLDCKNGGIGFNGVCISPLSYSDNAKDSTFSFSYPYPDLAPKNDLNLSDCSIDLNSVCSWRRNAAQIIRRENCHTQLDPHTTSLNEFLTTLFSVYGPWSENDKLMLHYLLGNSSKTGPLRYYNSKNEKGYTIHHNLPEADRHIFLSPHTSFSPVPVQTARLAFVIMVHTHVHRLDLFLSTMWQPRNLYVIHLDGKLDNEQVALAFKIISKYSNGNIQVLPERFRGTWGGISLVYINLAGIIKLLEMDQDSEHWTHVINLSLFDMNTKPIYRLSEFLSMDVHKHRNMLALEPRLPRQHRQTEIYASCGKYSIQVSMDDPSLCGGDVCVLTSTKHLENPLHPTSISNWMYKLPNNGMHYIEGSQWNFLTRDFGVWLVSDFQAIEMLFSFKNTFIPDESYFQTSIYNSPFRHTILDNNFRWTDWKKNLRVDMEDVENLKWGHHFFIRKVWDENVAQAIIDEVFPLWSYTNTEETKQ